MKRKGRVFTASLGVWLILVTVFAPVAQAQGAPPCFPPPGNLVGWWRGENDAADSWDGHHGTALNGATYAPGTVGQAFSLDGADDRVDLGGLGISKSDQEFSIAAWIRPDTLPVAASQVIVANGQSNVDPPNYMSYVVQLYVTDEDGAGGVALGTFC